MPLLSKRIFNCVKPLIDVKPDEKIYTIPHTKEQLRFQEEYDKRMQLYKKRIWTCQSTGHVNLTHEEAWNSEKAVLKTLKEQFAPCYDKPVLELVHHCTKSLDTLVDETWVMLQQVLVVGERVLLKVKSGKSMKAVIVKADPAGYEGNPTSNCNSPSSDKENKDNNASSPKKWIPPKLLPYKYSIRFENEDSVIHSVPANDLSRGDKPPSKELLRLFIRTYAVRAGHTPNSPWIVDDAQVKKLDLQSKFASFLLSPVKWKADEIAKKINEEIRNLKSRSKGSPRIKTKMDAKEERRREHAKKSISKIEKKGEKLKQQKEKQSRRNEVIELDYSDDSSSSEMEDDSNVIDVSDRADSDSDTPLSVVKTQLTPKKKSSSDDPEKEEKIKKKESLSLADLQKQIKTKGKDHKVKDGKSKKPLTLADIKQRLEKKQLKKLEKKKRERKRSRKGQDPKQMTLLDSLKKKGLKTPEKKLRITSKDKSPLKEHHRTPDMKKLMSPPRTPIVVQKLQRAMKKEDKMLIGIYSTQAAKILTNSQREKLSETVKGLVMTKYNVIQERIKLAKMSEDEKKVYLEKKALERKEMQRKKMKERMKHSKKKYEDTALELKSLPQPKLVVTPDGLPNELFGDVAMVTEFISCYSGLLMPDDEYPIYTDALMKALATGKDGFTYLCRTLTVMLQTLLQDQIAEDYQELKVPLSDIPVNPGTCSELVRLCLRRQDVTDDKSDTSDPSDELEEGEVPDELIQLLETQELYQLEAEQKLAILKGLCERIMGTYSVQDYMEEKHQDSARLWREQIAKWKEDKANQQAKKAEEKQKKESEKDTQDDSKKVKTEKEKDAPTNNTLLTQFYGKKDEDGQTSGNSSETAMEVDDDDVMLKIRRRRFTSAQAVEERRKKDKEERIKREKEMEIQRQQKEKEQFEKDFSEGLILAKITQRQAPIGTDRNHSRYWVFCDVTPGVFVEKGWVGDEIEYSCRKDTDDIVESSSSEEEEDEVEDGANPPGTAKKNKPNRVAKCVDTTFPHVGQNLWFTYDRQSAVTDLMNALHPQGSRESHLKRELNKRQADITRAIFRQQRSNNELRDCDGDKEMIESLKKELLETELRLRNGGLGGVDDFPTWSVKLETAVDVQPLADCFLECQANVLKKFRDGIMVVTKKKSATVKEEEEEEEEEKVEAPGIQHWRDAVQLAGTFSRLHVLLGILDSCIRWEKSAENAKCKICRKKGEEDKLLLCDDCNQAFHIYCLRPALPCVPKGDWKCAGCAPLARKRVIDLPGKYQEYSDEDDGVKEAKSKSIKHDEACFECGGDESLILCAECPSTYHLECHDPPLRHPPRGRWVCNDCKNGVKRRTRRGAVSQDARKKGRPAAKRKRYAESSEEESSDDQDEGDEEDEDDEETKPPHKKAARTSKGRVGKPGRPKQAKSESPRGEETKSKGRRSVPSPEMIYVSTPKVSRRAPSELSVIEAIINKMLEFKAAWPFWLNVNKRDVPDYYKIIKQPISFQKIKDRLNCLVYGSPQEVIDAVALVFRNAVEYNKIGSEVYDCIELSEKYFVDLLKRLLPFYAYNRDTKANGYGDHMYSDDGSKTRKSK